MPPGPWVLNTQADIDLCAEELLAAGFPNTVRRGHDEHGNDVREIEIDIPDDPQNPQKAPLGKVAIIPFGTPQVITVAQYEASPFYLGGS